MLTPPAQPGHVSKKKKASRLITPPLTHKVVTEPKRVRPQNQKMCEPRTVKLGFESRAKEKVVPAQAFLVSQPKRSDLAIGTPKRPLHPVFIPKVLLSSGPRLARHSWRTPAVLLLAVLLNHFSVAQSTAKQVDLLGR